MNPDAIRSLDGKNVMIKPAVPDDPNSVGLRGTLRVRETASQGLRVEIVVAYPERSDVNGPPAHEEIIPLSQTDITALLASDVNHTGTCEFTLDDGGRTVP
jgi:hypothetical protein